MTEQTMKCDTCGTEFSKRFLRCTSCHEIGISKLYKYVNDSDYSRSNLKNKTIWFPAAESLNDPFEFSFHCPELQINGIPIDVKSFNDAIQSMKQMGVLSLSEINNNILMWSHYACSHTGFCIEFERTDFNELGNWDYCAPINYDENLPMFNPIELEEKKAVTKILLTKSNLWAYEKEWRMITKQGNQTYPLPGKITGIIFGFKMPIEKRQEIAGILGISVRYMQANKSLTKFDIDISTLTLDELKAE